MNVLRAAKLLQPLLASPSPGKIFLLNQVFSRLIPFNSPHGFRILSLGETQTQILLPFKRKNLNHLGGLHACSLATAGEMAAGIQLIRHFPFSQYRIILKNLSAIYLKQGKGDQISSSRLDETKKAQLEKSLQQDSIAEVEMLSRIGNDAGEICSEVRTLWQLKSWSKVSSAGLK